MKHEIVFKINGGTMAVLVLIVVILALGFFYGCAYFGKGK